MEKAVEQIKTDAEIKTEQLLATLHNTKPIGKWDAPKAIIEPWPDEINALLSVEPTKLPTVEEILTQELFNIPTIKIQRGLDLVRLNKTLRYLKNAEIYCSETGRLFSAVKLPNGKLYLIDGNTRVANYYNELRRAFEKGEAPRFDIPKTVTLVTHLVDDEEHSKLLYYTCDAAAAAEKAGEKMTGAIEALEADFTKIATGKGNYKQGLKERAKLIPGIDIGKTPSEEYCLIEEFLSELQYIDKMANFTGKVIGGDDVAIIAIMLRKNRQSKREMKSIMKFANGVASQTAEGSVIDKNGKKNGIAHLHAEYFAETDSRKFPHRSCKRKEVFGLWIYYYEKWCEDEMDENICPLNVIELKELGDKYLKS